MAEERRNLLVYSLAADVAGNMWIGTLGDGLYRYSLKSRHVRALHRRAVPRGVLVRTSS